jgi:hypothetical protein
MKKITIKLSILLLPIGMLVLSINCIVDPANLISGETYVENIAQILAKGNNVDNISNYDERLLQKHYLEKKKTQNPDIIVMGSSRIMEIGNDIFPNKKIFNIGVSHANINDLVALAGLLDEYKIKPKAVLINLDPFLICQDDKSDEWISLFEYHQKFIKIYSDMPSKEIPINNLFKKYYTLLTFDYFNSSIQYIIKGNTKSIVDIGKTIPKKYGRLSNGCVAYSYDYRNPDTLIVADVAKKTGEQLNLDKIDNSKLKMLHYLLKYFKNKGIKYSFIMLPYHKEFYNSVNKKQNDLLKKYETFFVNFASQNRIPLIGSLSPLKCKLNNLDFYDPYHCSGNAIKKIVENNN